MDNLLNINEFMYKLAGEGVTPEEMINRSLRNLYVVENTNMMIRNKLMRNRLRAVIAYVKLLYDHGQQMALSRTYLLHKVKLLEVRENDYLSEISILRGISPLNVSENPLGTSDLNESQSVKRSRLQGKVNDMELGIIIDTKSINEIDQSHLALLNISQRIADKKQVLLDIDKQLDDVSKSVCYMVDPQSSLMELERSSSPPFNSSGVECPQDLSSSKHPRDGDTRTLSPNITTIMELQGQERNLLSQGEIGTSRDRQSGEPDAARSSSDEGTAGMDAGSVPAVQAVTAEHNLESNIGDRMSPLYGSATGQIGEKRKASTSPGSEASAVDNVIARRPNKTRIIESNEPRSSVDVDRKLRASDSINSSPSKDISTVKDSSMSASSPEERRITRGTVNKAKRTADFTKLKESRRLKEGTSYNVADNRYKERNQSPMEKYEPSRSESTDRIIRQTDDLIKRINSTNEELSSENSFKWTSPQQADRSNASKKKKRNSFSSKEYTEYSSDCETEEETSTQSRTKTKTRGKVKANKMKDKTVKNPITKSRNRTIPIVLKEEVDIEASYSREKWMDMAPAALGARCLEHLAELERQRSLCSNISGRIAGRLKDGNAIVAQITRAFIEKLAIDDSAYDLKMENIQLKEEINSLKHKEVARDKEIDALRKTINNLRRDLKALKEGFGPFPVNTQPVPPLRGKQENVMDNARSTQMDKVKLSTDFLPQEDNEMEIEVFTTDTPGCSIDEAYMNRQMAWPTGKDATPWTHASDNDNVSKKSKYNNKTYVSSKNRFTNDKIDVIHNARAKGIRIIENRQIVPPSYPDTRLENNWTVIGKKGKVVRQNDTIISKIDGTSTSRERKMSAGSGNTAKPKVGKKLVKPAVVTITSKPDGASYAQILAKAREKVSLRDLGIQNTVVRRAMNGAIVIEVPGPQGKQLARALSCRLTEALGDEARVFNPVATGEIRLRGIDPSTTLEEIGAELTAIGECSPADLKISAINTMRDGMGAAWIVCPLEIAIKIAEKGTIALGWTRVKIELLKKRPVQCYKCWRFGHIRNNCRSEIDRTGTCFRCGVQDHAVQQCKATFRCCLICKEDRKEYRHRIGSPICLANQGFPSGVQPIRRVSTTVDIRNFNSSDGIKANY